MCGAPTVLIGMSASPAAQGQNLSGLTIVTAGAPPAPQVIRTMEGLGATVHHVYGLTETYGPHTICAFQPGWDELPLEERAQVKARQGVPYIVAGTGMRVVDHAMHDVPRDGQTMGEVVMRGDHVGRHARPYGRGRGRQREDRQAARGRLHLTSTCRRPSRPEEA